MTGLRLVFCAMVLAILSAGALVFIGGAFVVQSYVWVSMVTQEDRGGALAVFAILCILCYIMFYITMEK